MSPERFHRISKALADPRRLQILQSIAAGDEVACSSLCRKSTVSQATMSHHLKDLVNAGLVTARREAKFVFYRFQQPVWSKYLAEMQRRIPSKPPKR
jgi:ArsR family transcriptional regulator